MIRKSIALAVGLVSPAWAMAQSCLIGMPPLIQYSFFDLAANATAAVNANSNVLASLNGASDAWDASNADDRFIFFLTSNDDCPGINDRQIGAFSYSGTDCSWTNDAPENVLARTITITTNRSVMINLDHPWHAGSTPASGEFHLQSVLTHEFGHVLGFAHMTNGECDVPPEDAETCYENPDAETMNAVFASGTTCKATIESNDISSANSLYP